MSLKGLDRTRRASMFPTRAATGEARDDDVKDCDDGVDDGWEDHVSSLFFCWDATQWYEMKDMGARSR